MNGSVRKDGSTWYNIIELGKDANGKRKQKKKRGFKTKKEAQQALTQAISQLMNGTYVEPSKVTYADLLNDWLEDKRNKVKQQSIENYCLIAKTHIIPKLGSFTLQQITPVMIQKFVNDLRNQGLSDTYIRKVLVIINGSLKKAELWGMIHKNPTGLIEKPRVTKRKCKFGRKRGQIIPRGSERRPPFLLAVTTGMRQGEILGLRWKDVDLDNGMLRIFQTLSHDGKTILSGAKTKGSIRSIYLPPETVQALKKHRSIVIQEKLLAGAEYEDHDLVVCTSKGTPIIPSNLNRTWWRLQKQAGVKRIRFHDLRHTHATLLIKQGVHVKIVAEDAGHLQPYSP